MKIAKNIKVKGWIWKILPYPYKTAQAVYPNIIVPDFVYEDLHSDKPNLRYKALIKHEEFHLKRQKRIGLAKFIFYYMLSRKFRYTEELLAYREEQKFLRNYKLSLDLDKVAKSLSSPLYLWSVSFKKVRKELEV